MIIDCISDLHGHYPQLEGGDLLIVAGDLTARDSPFEYGQFAAWLARQRYTKKVLISGNHDGFYEMLKFEPVQDAYLFLNVDYLQDSGCEFEGLKIWGSPWTKKFHGMNHNCMAFTVDTDEELSEKWKLIPRDTDILITHGPPVGALDKTVDNDFVGSISLSVSLGFFQNLKLHVFGHIHESYGKIEPPEYLPNYFDVCKHYSVNASHVNEYYEPVNEPIRVIL